MPGKNTGVGLPFPTPGHLPDKGLNRSLLHLSRSGRGFFTAEPPGKPPVLEWIDSKVTFHTKYHVMELKTHHPLRISWEGRAGQLGKNVQSNDMSVEEERNTMMHTQCDYLHGNSRDSLGNLWRRAFCEAAEDKNNTQRKAICIPLHQQHSMRKHHFSKRYITNTIYS